MALRCCVHARKRPRSTRSRIDRNVRHYRLLGFNAVPCEHTISGCVAERIAMHPEFLTVVPDQCAHLALILFVLFSTKYSLLPSRGPVKISPADRVIESFH